MQNIQVMHNHVNAKKLYETLNATLVKRAMVIICFINMEAFTDGREYTWPKAILFFAQNWMDDALGLPRRIARSRPGTNCEKPAKAGDGWWEPSPKLGADGEKPDEADDGRRKPWSRPTANGQKSGRWQGPSAGAPVKARGVRQRACRDWGQTAGASVEAAGGWPEAWQARGRTVGAPVESGDGRRVKKNDEKFEKRLRKILMGSGARVGYLAMDDRDPELWPTYTPTTSWAFSWISYDRFF